MAEIALKPETIAVLPHMTFDFIKPYLDRSLQHVKKAFPPDACTHHRFQDRAGLESVWIRAFSSLLKAVPLRTPDLVAGLLRLRGRITRLDCAGKS